MVWLLRFWPDQFFQGKNEIQFLQQVDILISKNQALQILYLKHHDNVYKTS